MQAAHLGKLTTPQDLRMDALEAAGPPLLIVAVVAIRERQEHEPSRFTLAAVRRAPKHLSIAGFRARLGCARRHLPSVRSGTSRLRHKSRPTHEGALDVLDLHCRSSSGVASFAQTVNRTRPASPLAPALLPIAR